MNAWTVLVWAAAALFLVDLAFLYAAQFLYFFFYGTKYDTVPWLFSWMTNDAFIVTPGVDTGISAAGSDGFTPEQWQQIYYLLLLEWVIITLINESTSTFTNVAEDDIEAAQTTASKTTSSTPGGETLSNPEDTSKVFSKATVLTHELEVSPV